LADFFTLQWPDEGKLINLFWFLDFFELVYFVVEEWIRFVKREIILSGHRMKIDV
jgi:hypothetical protein